MTNIIKAAFETWHNGTSCSGLYIGEDAQKFVLDHEASGTFAQIHIFYDLVEGITAYEQLAIAYDKKENCPS